jgi:hypothetical protein
MKLIYPIAVLLIITSCSSPEPKDQWISLFNGKDLSGWIASENQGTFSVQDGLIVTDGERSHLFYNGDVEGHEFKNFEFKAEVKTTPGSNSGIFFHTTYQQEGWPFQGYESQVNNTHTGEGDYRELKKTGSLYAVRNTYKQLVPENQWFNYYIKVVGNHIQIRINDMLVVDYLQPAPQDSLSRARFKGTGTFALQGHDPHSKVYYRNIQVKPLPDNQTPNNQPDRVAIENKSYQSLRTFMSEQHSFTDLGVQFQQGFDLESHLNFYYRSGINLGVVLDPDEYGQLEVLREHPVFIGAFNPPDSIDRSVFDYVIGTAGNYPENVQGNAFMDQLVESIITDLDQKQLDVWSKPTALPDPMMDRWSELWTNERVDKVIEAAVNNQVAIEIDNQNMLPPLDFISRAKMKGATFTYANLGTDSEMGELDYVYQAIEQGPLGYKDIFIPGFFEPGKP